MELAQQDTRNMDSFLKLAFRLQDQHLNHFRTTVETTVCELQKELRGETEQVRRIYRTRLEELSEAVHVG